jgi:UPF0042 nucleotide-binding protein
MQVVLISGLSGSGKSIALNVLEDSGYYCVDNLPAPLLSDLVAHLRAEGQALVAVAVDMRGGASIAALPPQLRKLEAERVTLRFVFLDARDEVLIQRFSETRRRHPLAGDDVTLEEAIAREREALEMLASLGHHIDTSNLRPNALRAGIKEFAALDEAAGWSCCSNPSASSTASRSMPTWCSTCAVCPTRITTRRCARSPGAMPR